MNKIFSDIIFNNNKQQWYQWFQREYSSFDSRIRTLEISLTDYLYHFSEEVSSREGRKPNSDHRLSHQHHVEQNVAGSLQRDRVPQGRKVEPQTWDSTNSLSLSLSPVLSETKSTKVYSWPRSLPIARRGNNDGRHMGDSPGAHQEPRRTFLSFLFSPPSGALMRARFYGLCMCAQKSRRHREFPLRRNDSAKTWRRREIGVRVTHR